MSREKSRVHLDYFPVFTCSKNGSTIISTYRLNVSIRSDPRNSTTEESSGKVGCCCVGLTREEDGSNEANNGLRLS